MPELRPSQLDVKPSIDINDLKSSIWQSTVRFDIRLTYDMIRQQLAINDSRLGRLAIVCEIYYTFRHFDIVMYFEIQAMTSKNMIMKLALNKNDVETHVSSGIKDIVYDRVKLNKHIADFLERVSFIRTPLYMRPCVQYNRQKGNMYQFENTFKGSLVKDTWLEKVAIEQTVVAQYIRQFGKFYAIFTIFKVTNISGFEVEVYFPKGQKRFVFQMFNEELMLIDKITIQRLYQVGSEDIRMLATANKGDYKMIKADIYKIMVRRV